MFNWIKKQLDKLPTSPGLLHSGPWHVHYRKGPGRWDLGGWSRGLTYDAACDYAEIFNGKVYHETDPEYLGRNKPQGLRANKPNRIK